MKEISFGIALSVIAVGSVLVVLHIFNSAQMKQVENSEEAYVERMGAAWKRGENSVQEK